MIRTRRAKQYVAVVGAIVGLVAIVAAVLTGGGLIESAQSGADPAAALTVAPPVPEEFGQLVDWMPDRATIRQVEPQTRMDLEAMLVRAWHRVDVAQRTGETDGLETWFFGPLVDTATTQLGERRSSITQLGHVATVNFYSLDGTIMGLDVTSSMRRQAANGLRTVGDERYEVVARLSDGNWRIQQLVRVDDQS